MEGSSEMNTEQQGMDELSRELHNKARQVYTLLQARDALESHVVTLTTLKEPDDPLTHCCARAVMLFLQVKTVPAMLLVDMIKISLQNGKDDNIGLLSDISAHITVVLSHCAAIASKAGLLQNIIGQDKNETELINKMKEFISS